MVGQKLLYIFKHSNKQNTMQTILGGTARLSLVTRRNQFFQDLLVKSDELSERGKGRVSENEAGAPRRARNGRQASYSPSAGCRTLMKLFVTIYFLCGVLVALLPRLLFRKKDGLNMPMKQNYLQCSLFTAMQLSSKIKAACTAYYLPKRIQKKA